jgi:hypothetical protein
MFDFLLPIIIIIIIIIIKNTSNNEAPLFCQSSTSP